MGRSRWAFGSCLLRRCRQLFSLKASGLTRRTAAAIPSSFRPLKYHRRKTAARPGRARTAGQVVRRVTRLQVLSATSPVTTPSTALAVDKVPSSINFVESGQIERTNSLEQSRIALQQNVAGLNINEVAGNPFQPNVEFRGFVGSPVSLGTPQGLAVYQNGIRINDGLRRAQSIGI